LNQGGFADPATSCDFGKELAFAGEHPLQFRKLFFSPVKFPVRHVASGEIKLLYLN
jgi:hypothetical protein